MSHKDRFLVILVTILWGFNFVIIRWGMEGVDAVTMTILRFLFTAIPIIFFIKKPDLPIKTIALYGVCFGVGIWGLVNLAVSVGMPAGYASLLLQLSAFLTVMAGVLVFKEKLSLTKKTGIGVAFLGFAIVVINRGDSIPIFGVALVFLAAIFWTLCNIIIKINQPRNVVSFIAWSSLFVPLPLLVVLFFNQYISGENFFGLETFQFPSITGWASILFQSFITTLIGYGVWSHLISKHGLSNVAPYSLLVPVSGLFFGWLLYQENLTIIELTGCFFVILGLILLSVNIELLFNNIKIKFTQLSK